MPTTETSEVGEAPSFDPSTIYAVGYLECMEIVFKVVYFSRIKQ